MMAYRVGFEFDSIAQTAKLLQARYRNRYPPLAAGLATDGDYHPSVSLLVRADLWRAKASPGLPLRFFS